MKLRIKNCTEKLKKLNLDSLLISDSTNIAYLTGFSADNSYLLLTRDGGLIYFTNFLYGKAAKEINPVKNRSPKATVSSNNENIFNGIKSWEVIVSGNKHNLFTLTAKKIKALNLKRVGFEAKKLLFLEHKVINWYLSAWSIDFIETRDLVEEVRMIKSSRELSFIRKSIRISKESFELAREIFDPEMSEKGLSIEIERFLRFKGDNEIAFPSIVASGKNTVFPHHKSGNKKLTDNFSLIDLGSKYHGYCADLTRMFFWSKIPFLLKEIYDTVKKAQSLSIKKIKDGVKASEVDKAAREFIDKKGWGKYFGHGVGHGVGLSVHEPPILGPNCDYILKEGMVITIEPAIYLRNKFGVRLEEMVLVKSKKGEILSGHFYR